MNASCHRPGRVGIVAVLLSLAAMTAAARQNTGTLPTVRPIGQALRVDPPFSFDKKKTRRSVSGIACPAGGAKPTCLVVFDEGTKAQFARVHAKRLAPTGPLIELTGTGGELDAEGAAFADGVYYVTGSHAVKRESCEPNPTSRMLVRFKAESSAGSLPQVKTAAMATTTRLWDLMLRDPYLRAHAEGCLGHGSGGSAEQMSHRPGLNIEGLAVVGSRLYVGFRGPSEDGLTPVFSVDARALFEGGDAAPRLFRLALGQQAGIRDMAAAGDSLLLLIGPDDHAPSAGARWTVAQWKPGAAGEALAKPRMLATLDIRQRDIGDACVDALKPEAMALLGESASAYHLLVLSDGVCDGGPLRFDIPK